MPQGQPAAARRVPAHEARSRAARLARLLDSQFRIPGTDYRIGLDGIVGIIPGIGDTVTTALSLIIIAEAVHLGVSKPTLAKMLGNVAIDWLVGLVPVAGDVFDIMYKANLRNVDLLERELAARDFVSTQPPRPAPGSPGPSSA